MGASSFKNKNPLVFVSSLTIIASNYTRRCDAKIADKELLKIEASIRASGSFQIGDYLPEPFAKGGQPEYLDLPSDDSVPVVNTLAVQKLAINEGDCRHISRDDFESLNKERKLRRGDVLLTVDGGVSIGKVAHFDRDDDFTVDSHVCVLRPRGISSLGLVCLLASPIGQMQFRRAESGASGQTTVTEEDVRQFIFPTSVLKTLDKVAAKIETERHAIAAARDSLDIREGAIWNTLGTILQNDQT